MRSPFLCPYKVTQAFGINKQDYVQYGLNGHEGVDLVPTDFYWGVHATEAGIVIEDIDNPVGRIYGNCVRIKTKTNRVCLYAHMSENIVSLGQEVKEGQLIGIMGNTGHSLGAHIHYSNYDVDANGKKVNEQNGFKGCYNPLAI